MPIIRVAGRTAPVPGSMVRSILVSLQSAGVPIETLCGGRGRCGKCAVRIISGTEFLRPARKAELERLASAGAPPDARLACQTFARGDVSLEVCNPRASPPRAPPSPRAPDPRGAP